MASMAAADAILRLTEAFKKDANPEKINLGVGVYQDADGKTPILKCVREAQQRLLTAESTKSYLPIPGTPEYGKLARELMFGADHEILASNRAVTVQAPGGTGALRVACDFVKQHYPNSRVWMSKPTWANHPQIIAAAGLDSDAYPYFDAANNALAFDAMIQGLGEIPTGDVVLLHACCHNPSGIDPSPEQWAQIADVVAERKLLPLLDFAYQGFGDGLREDPQGVLAMCRPGAEALICSSFSKNFGLYRERVGALTVVAASDEVAQKALSQVKRCVRTNYSNPPAHGGQIVATVLADADLRALWLDELAEMRGRIRQMRQMLVDTLKAKGVTRDFSFITRQRGMFSFSGLTPEQVDRLREEYSIYIVRSGRINVAGITPANCDRLCDAIAAVL